MLQSCRRNSEPHQAKRSKAAALEGFPQTSVRSAFRNHRVDRTFDKQPFVERSLVLNHRLTPVHFSSCEAKVLRFISVPAVMVAFLIASQVSGAGIFHSRPMHAASE
jgi:hypothetical protein